jgi:hypothetical protein
MVASGMVIAAGAVARRQQISPTGLQSLSATKSEINALGKSYNDWGIAF